MKKIFIIVLFIFSAKYIGISEQINPDAVFNKIRYEFTLNEDGSIVYTYEHTLKYISYFAVNRTFGESFIIYNPDYQTLKINKSNTLMTNGELVSSPFNAFNEVLPGVASQTPAYMNLREMVVTHTGLERDCEVNFGYTITTKAGFLPGLFGKVIIGGHDPIKNLEIIIKVPQGKKLNLLMNNNGPMGEKFTKDKYDVYYWKIPEMPLIPIENGQTPFEEFLPTLYFSTLTASEIVSEILLSDKDLFTLNQKAKDFVQVLTKDEFSFSDKVNAIKNYVTNNIRSSNIGAEYIGLKPKKSQYTFDNASGSYLDNAILLIALYRAVGIKAELAITSNYPNAKPDITLLSQFGNYLVFCNPENEKEQIMLVDPNHKQNYIIPEVMQGRPALVINSEKLFIIPEIKDDNFLKFNSNLKLENDVLKGNAAVFCSGKYFESADIKSFDSKVNSSLKNQNWVNAKTELTPAIFSNNQYKKEISLEYNISKKPSGLKVIELLSFPNTSFSQNIKILPVSRVSPFKLVSNINEDYTINLELPENTKALYSSVNINEENKVGKLKIVINQDGKNLSIQKSLEIKSEYVSPENYHLLYKLISIWLNERYNKIILE